MKAPFALRAQVAWTVLTGTYGTISVYGALGEGTRYRVEVEPKSVTWWKRRNERRKIRAMKREAYEKSKEVV